MAIVFGILPMLIVVPLQNMMVVFVNEIWDAGGSGLGIMMAVMGAGGVAGSLLMTWLPDDSLTKPMVIGTLCMGVLLLLFAHSANFWLAAVMLMGVSSCSVVSQTLVQSAVQLMSDDYIRGRITTITLMSFSLTPVGTIPLAYAVKHVGAQWGLTIAAALLTLGVLLIWKGSAAFRRIDLAAKVEYQGTT
jgi:predicted MFS family arabinose efflux permease